MGFRPRESEDPAQSSFTVVIGKTPRHERRSCADNFSPGWSRQDARRLRLNKIFGSGREVVSTGGRLTVDVTPRGAIGRRNRGGSAGGLSVGWVTRLRSRRIVVPAAQPPTHRSGE